MVKNEKSFGKNSTLPAVRANKRSAREHYLMGVRTSSERRDDAMQGGRSSELSIDVEEKFLSL